MFRRNFLKALAAAVPVPILGRWFTGQDPYGVQRTGICIQEQPPLLATRGCEIQTQVEGCQPYPGKAAYMREDGTVTTRRKGKRGPRPMVGTFTSTLDDAGYARMVLV